MIKRFLPRISQHLSVNLSVKQAEAKQGVPFEEHVAPSIPQR